MKKKLIISAAVLCSLLVVLWVVGRVTGMLLFFSIPTPSNLPNIRPGDKVYSSNVKEPALYNFIVFTSNYADSVSMLEKRGSQYLFRLCAIPGNIIEMKNGVLFVNNKNFDEKINLNNQYIISSAESDLIDPEDMEAMELSGGASPVSKDFTLVTFDSILIKKYSSTIKPAPFIMAHSENGPFKWYNKSEQWTPDNFGPLKIPTGCYFVLGDNRHNALDSRYIGFVKKEDIKGVVLNK